MTNWIPTDRIRGGYEPAESLQNKEYSDLSVFNPTIITPGSYGNPIGAVVPPITSVRPAPPQLDPVQLIPSPPPDIPTSGSWSSKTSSSSTTSTDGTTKTTTTTTTTQSSLSFNNGVVDVSIIPYMRRIDVDFYALGLRPNRRVYFFFDEVNVTDYISLHNTFDLDDYPTEPNVVAPNIDDIDDDTGTIGDQIIANSSPGWTISGSPGASWHRRDYRGRRRMHVRRRRRIVNPDGSNGSVRLEISSMSDTVAPNSIMRIVNKGSLYKIAWNEVRTGSMNSLKWFLTSSDTANTDLIRSTIILGDAFKNMPNNWWGTDGSNTAFFVTHFSHPKRGRNKARIRGWNNGNRWLTVDPDSSEDVPGFTVNPFASVDDAKLIANDGGDYIGDSVISISPTDPSVSMNPGDPIPVDATGTFRTDETGSIAGCFHIPGGIFFTGQRIFRIIDNITNDASSDATTTMAEYKFVSQGLHEIVQDVVINSTMTNTTIKKTTVPPPPPSPPPPGVSPPPASPPPALKPKRKINLSWFDIGKNPFPSSHDPLAQTFWVEPTNYPQGMFLSSVDLFFGNKDPIQPVHIEVRPTVNGYPDSNFVVPGSKVSKQASEVKVSGNPSVTSSATATKFKFADPLYLPPGEYAIVVHSPSVNYEVFVSELGEKIIGTNNIVSEQPYVGSIFKSQNATTWDASQLEDLMFQINKCFFEPQGRAVFYSSAAMQSQAPYGLYPIPVDELLLHTEQAIIPGTGLSYELASESSNVYSEVQSGIVLIPDTGRIYYPANSDDYTKQEGFFKIAVNMVTDNPDVSPVVWSERMGAAMFENQIDNASPTPADFRILATGSGYPANSELALAFTGPNNGDAEAYAVSNATGHIVDIVFDSYGSGFVANSEVSVVSGSGSGAIIKMATELDPSGGVAWSKYISRIVTLNEGFDSADLRTYITAYKPIGTGIHVYYKVRNNNDPEPFSAKPWSKMIQKEYLVDYSRSTSDYLEFEFTPFGEDEPFESISYTSGGATYTTFDQFAIKIVITSDSTTYFPVLRNMRAIALPAVEQL